MPVLIPDLPFPVDVMSSLNDDIHALGAKWLYEKTMCCTEIHSLTPFDYLRSPLVLEKVVELDNPETDKKEKVECFSERLGNVMDRCTEAIRTPPARRTRAAVRTFPFHESPFSWLAPINMACIFLFVHPRLGDVVALKRVNKAFNQCARYVSELAPLTACDFAA
jgi:hypothetical protein